VAADPRSPIVEALADALLAAWNRHDATALAAVFAPDADLVNFRGRRLSGQTEIQKFFARAFAQNLKESQVAPGEHRIRFVADAVATLDLSGTLTGMKDPTGTTRPPRSFLCDGTVVPNPRGGWWIIVGHLREAPLEAKAPPSPGGSAPPAPSAPDPDA
jgi:uncharacterized protein (TIGR02246 family)